MELFTCKDCAGLCCTTPPMLRENEISFVIKNGAKINAIKDGKKFFVVIRREGDFCPFLDKESRECKIYENRFYACSAYSCGNLNKTKRDVFIKSYIMFASNLTQETTTKREDFLIDKKTIKSFNIKEVDLYEYIQEDMAHDSKFLENEFKKMENRFFTPLEQ